MEKFCKCCERNVSNQDTRLDICWDCAESESIIADGTDMYDKIIVKDESLEDYSIHLSKLKTILKKYIN